MYPRSAPRPINNSRRIHHRVQQLPHEIQPYLNYVPIVRSFGEHTLQHEFNDVLPKSEWMSDYESSVCLRCTRTFMPFMRPVHHCRVCGQLVCDSCSSMVWSGYAHIMQTPKSCLETCLETPLSYTGQLARVCNTCRSPFIQLRDTYSVIRNIPQILLAFPELMPNYHFGDFLHNMEDRCQAKILQKCMISIQYIWSNPWNAPLPKNTHRFVLSRDIAKLLKFQIYDHFYYRIGYEYLCEEPPPKQTHPVGCSELNCRESCQKTDSMEVLLTNLFVHRTICSTWNIELARLLTPTLLFRGITNPVFLTLLENLISEFKEPLEVHVMTTLLSLNVTPQFSKIIQDLIQPQLKEDFMISWNFFNDLCVAASFPLTHPIYSKIQHILRTQKIYIPGYPTFQLVQLHLHKIQKARSSSQPLIIPCTIYNNNKYISHKLLVKYNQALHSDVMVHYMIAYLKTKIHHPEDIVTYPTVPIGPNGGIILIVPDAQTLHSIPKKTTLPTLIHQHPKTRHIPRHELDRKFAYSAAFFTILTCFLGIRDRIDSNMMVIIQKSLLFHIDFEFMFNQQPPFKETARSIGDFLASSASSTTSSLSLIMKCEDGVSLQPLLPEHVLHVLGDMESRVYKTQFTPSCNYFFQLMWDLRHLFYFCTQFLPWVPSTIGVQLTHKEHKAFYRNLVQTILEGSDTFGERACKITVNTDASPSFIEKTLTKLNHVSLKFK